MLFRIDLACATIVDNNRKDNEEDEIMPDTTPTSASRRQRAQYTAIGAMIVIALVALAGIILFTERPQDSVPRGAAYQERNKDLGVASIVSKQDVVDVFGADAKDVKDASISGVLNYNGNRGQTATYAFTLPSGAQHASLDVDVMRYASKEAFDAAMPLNGGGDLGEVAGHAVKYLPALVIAGDRQYSILFANGNDIYKLTLLQPTVKPEILEYKAQDIMKELVKRAKML